MLHKFSLAALVVAAELVLMIDTAAAFDDSKYPDWSGQWRRRPASARDGIRPSVQDSLSRRH
jgi:hypothetical protein